MLQKQYPQTTGLKKKPTINETAERIEHAIIPLVGSGGVLLTPKPGEP